MFFAPAAELAAAASALGHNLFILDPDGPLRHTVPFVRTGDRAMPSLGLAAALRVAGIRGVRRAPRERHSRWPAIGGCRSSGGVSAIPTAMTSYLWGLINFRGPRCSPT